MTISSYDFIESYLNDNDDMIVIPDFTRGGPFFKRVKSGHQIEIGRDRRFTYNSVFSIKPREVSEDAYLASLELKVRWLPNHHNQGIREQIRHHNLFFTVDGTKRLPGWKSSPYFFCSPFGFFLDTSPIQKEWRRLREIEENERITAKGRTATIKLRQLNAQKPFCAHPVLTS